MTFVQRYK